MITKSKLSICLLCLLTFGAIPTLLFARETTRVIKPETKKVRVTVKDSDGQLLPGALIKAKGGKPVRPTDINGVAVLDLSKGAVITVSYTGMETQTLTIGDKTDITVTLNYKSAVLDQVIVTGYSTTTKKRTTGSVAVIDSKELNRKPMASADHLLQGVVAGLDVKAVSGRPGEAAKIRIRGINTITGSADPLWVVDGVPMQRDIPQISTTEIKNGDFNNIFMNGIGTIPPNDIESVTVLKDASAAAIYGSQAAGGVIIVTTKRGKEGKMSVSYSTNWTLVSAPPRDARLMNSREKLAFEQELWDEFSAKRKEKGERYPVIGIVGAIRSGAGIYKGWDKARQDEEIKALGEHTTDWFGEIFRNALSHSHHLTLSGGEKKITYYTSAGYSREEGLVKRTNAERSTFNLKLNLKPIDRLKADLSADLSYLNSDGSSLSVDPFSYAYFANPYEKPYDSNGNYLADNTYFSLLQNSGIKPPFQLPPNGFNIFREMENTHSTTKNYTGNIKASVSYRFSDHLSFDGLASVGFTNNTSENVNGKDTYTAWLDRPFDIFSSSSTRRYGSITQTSATNTSYILRGQLNYFNTFANNHNVSALIGSEIRSQYAKSIYEKRYGYDPVSGNSSTPTLPPQEKYSESDLKRYANIIDGLAGQSIFESAFASFYFSADYNYRNRYVFSLTARTDGSNSFGTANQFNPTGSVGLAWNADQEDFMQSLKPYLSTLSMRISGGYTGNVNKSAYPYFVMRYLPRFRKTEDDNLRIGQIKTPPNPRLRWEKTRDINAALEVGFLDDRIKVSTEIYDRYTTDAVTSVPVVTSNGFLDQNYNTSELRNQGIEFTLGATLLKSKDWMLKASANIGMNRNKLIKYVEERPSYLNKNIEGYPIGSLFTGKVEGIDPVLGVYTYERRPDAKMETPEDRQNPQNYLFYIGTENAPVNGGYSVNLTYKQLSMGLSGTFSTGGYVFNEVTPPVSYRDFIGLPGDREMVPDHVNDLYGYHVNTTKDAIRRWTPTNPITDGRPRIIDRYGDRLYLDQYMVTASSITKSSRLESLSYFKLSSLYVGYSFEGSWLKHFGISSLNASLSASNLFILTNYSGIDPETPGAVYPIPRTYTFGLSVGF
ncbi:SusC/RagA family TonB-linked outer membrane protein [Porphyromonas sp.]|uniref:SusC/RagA family TonB-linked outer membrane protein n=1 Tax=Porphyromonas sp. TaxID=1924944 RepID=UPI0026DD74F4|nr:SusC/RagA family TonB-linked outer membrane protein [Porphyromonas sp.]MDO4771382.1 SusC/RagA family TonB-linked outer membrane protein [Porphyromonas sp.]